MLLHHIMYVLYLQHATLLQKYKTKNGNRRFTATTNYDVIGGNFETNGDLSVVGEKFLA